jgi:hypothetical protein
VFVLWGGANDYTSKEPFSADIGTLLDTPDGAGGYLRVVDEVVAALADQVRQLHAAGARRVAVVNLSNLGLNPIVLHNTSYRREAADGEPTMLDSSCRIEFARKLGDLTLHHNRELAGSRSSSRATWRGSDGCRRHHLWILIGRTAPEQLASADRPCPLPDPRCPWMPEWWWRRRRRGGLQCRSARSQCAVHAPAST